MSFWWKNIRRGLKEGTETNKLVHDWKLQETWEDYPMPNYKDKHMYCLVKLEDGGATLYYRTRNPELQVGDRVYVPLGGKYDKKVGIIVSMKEYRGNMAPYPLERTKHIIGKV